MNFQLLDQLMDRMEAMGIHAADLVVTQDHQTIYRKLVGFSDYAKTKQSNFHFFSSLCILHKAAIAFLGKTLAFL